MSLYKTGLKMINMWVVRLTYSVSPHVIISGTAGKKN